MTKRALVRRPGPRLADGLLTHLERTPVDLDLAQRQWEAYVEALRAEGWETIEVPAGRRLPGRGVRRGHRRGARRPRGDQPARGRRAQARDRRHRGDAGRPRLPDRPHRGARHARRRRRAQARRRRVVGRARRPHQRRRGSSSSPRTWPRSAPSVVGVPVAQVLHLKSAVTALPDGTVVGFEPLVDDPAVVGRRSCRCPRRAAPTSWCSTSRPC